MAGNLNPFAKSRKPWEAAETKPRRRAGGALGDKSQLSLCYFAGALSLLELLLDLLLPVLLLLLLLWCLCLWLLPLCELVLADWSEPDVGGSAASTGPAMSARATTGMSFFNIDLVSRNKGCALLRSGMLHSLQHRT
jgi:hypothetical protein